MRIWPAAIPDFHYQIEALIAEDDLVVARTIFTGILTGRLAFETLTLPPSHKPMRVAETVIFRIADGKIVGDVESPEPPATAWNMAHTQRIMNRGS